MRITKRERRAISPAIASMLLIGVAVAGALTVSHAMSYQNQIAATSTAIDIVGVTLTKLQVDGKAYFAITIKNSGTTVISDAIAGFYDNNNDTYEFTADSINLKPGQQWSNSTVFDAEINVNSRYTVFVDAVSSNGSRYNDAKSVIALG